MAFEFNFKIMKVIDDLSCVGVVREGRELYCIVRSKVPFHYLVIFPYSPPLPSVASGAAASPPAASAPPASPPAGGGGGGGG